MSSDLQREGSHIAWLSQTIDETYPKDIDPEAHEWRRISKIGEEFGEVTAALLGSIGENPRKGYTHSPEDVEDELLDVALCALAAWEHRRGNAGGSLIALSDHARRTCERMRIALGMT